MHSGRPSTGSRSPIRWVTFAIRRLPPGGYPLPVDNSVWQRLPLSDAVRAAIDAVMDAEDELRCCALNLDEFGYGARSAIDHHGSADRMRSSFLFLPSSATADAVGSAIRAALWAPVGSGGGRGRRRDRGGCLGVRCRGAALRLRFRSHLQRISSGSRAVGRAPRLDRMIAASCQFVPRQESARMAGLIRPKRRPMPRGSGCARRRYRADGGALDDVGPRGCVRLVSLGAPRT